MGEIHAFEIIHDDPDDSNLLRMFAIPFRLERHKFEL